MYSVKPLPELTKEAVDRFWSYVDASDYFGCWTWIGNDVTKDGYGTFWTGPGCYRAHRVAYFIYYGVDPGVLRVLHFCDNPICVNPLHLVLGTNASNSEDMIRKGRSATGEKNGNAKLTEAKVKIIKSSPKYKVPSWQLAEQLDIDEGTVHNIRSGRTWAHVQC